MVPRHEHRVSSNGQSALVEPEQINDPNLRTVREQVVEAIDPLQKQLDATLHELDTSHASTKSCSVIFWCARSNM